MSQQILNKAIKKWLESMGFRALVTGNNHEFVVPVKDIFSQREQELSRQIKRYLENVNVKLQ